MSRLTGWFRGATPKSSVGTSPAGSQVDLLALEIAQVEDAMAGAAHIMNDDIDGAEAILKLQDSPFHLLGMGWCAFMRSILGFEKEVMAEASNRLTAAENAAWAAMKKAQKEGKRGDSIYPPGTEFALVHAEAQLMSAVVAVLHESLTEGIKGFYKLRKAFITLDGIMNAEAEYLKKRAAQIEASKEKVSKAPGGSSDEDTDLDFVDAAEGHSGTQTPAEKYEGHLVGDGEVEKEMANLTIDSEKSPDKEDSPKSLPDRVQLDHDPDSEIFTNPIDVFIHSGANMCFGILQLLISMVPPAFSRLLYIIGFKGDREKGITMMWQSSKFHNINGALAGYVLLAYYNGLIGFADILPSDEDAEKGAVVGYPKARTAALLVSMRTRYPDSRLWRLEEARTLANSRDLSGGIQLLSSNTDSKMRQVTALNHFELSLESMFASRWKETRDHFVRCVELNDWSHSLYYYLAGCAEVELYRDAFHAAVKEESEISLHKKKAEELLRKAPTVAGKKRFMSRPLPFEQYVLRKLQKWEERSKELGIDMVDAIGVSPAQEMVYLWNGSKRMGAKDLEVAEKTLSWDRLTASHDACTKIKAQNDDSAVQEVCLASVLRNLGKLDNARALIEPLLPMDRLAFKGATKDDWVLPSAHYEMAVLAWIEVVKPELRRSNSIQSNGATPESIKADEEAFVRKKTEECENWLDTVGKWEAFVLDARVGMRVSTAKDTLRWFKRKHGWATA